jgi:hypothetical protein
VPSSATGCSISSPAPPGGGGTRPAATCAATASCSRGHPRAAVSWVDPSGPDTIARRPPCRTHPGRGRSGHRLRRHPCGGHPGLGSRPRPGCAAAVDTVGGDWRPLPWPAEWAWTISRRRPPCPCPAQRGLWPCPRRRAAIRSALWPHSRTASGHGGGVRFRGQPLGCGPGRRRRQRSTVRTRGPRTRPADSRDPQAAGTVDTRVCGRGRRTLRQRPAGQPAAEPSTAAVEGPD